MTFLEHLEELRTRVFRALIGVMAGVVVGWTYKEILLAWLLRPLEIAWFCRARSCGTRQVMDWMLHPSHYQLAYVQAGRPPAATIHFAGPTDAFVAYFKLAAMGGVIIALPVVFWQLWAFIAPGLYDREKKLVLPFVGFSTVFFLVGSLFGYYLVFPFGYKWFLDFSGFIPGTVVQIQPTIMMEDYLGFTAQMLLAFGVVFEMPLFIFFLALAGIVTSKQLFAFGRYFIVLAFVLAAVLTPSTDVYSQVMLAMPLVVLYFLAAVLAYFFGPKEARGFRKNLTTDTMAPAARAAVLAHRADAEQAGGASKPPSPEGALMAKSHDPEWERAANEKIARSRAGASTGDGARVNHDDHDNHDEAARSKAVAAKLAADEEAYRRKIVAQKEAAFAEEMRRARERASAVDDDADAAKKK